MIVIGPTRSKFGILVADHRGTKISDVDVPPTTLWSMSSDPTAPINRLLDDRRGSAFLIGLASGAGGETRGRELALLGIGRATLLDTNTITTFQDDPRSPCHTIAVACVMVGEFSACLKHAVTS